MEEMEEGCVHAELVVEEGMSMCTLCGAVVEGVDFFAEDGAEFFEMPSARPGGVSTRQPIGTRVRTSESAAHTAVLSLGDRSSDLRARLRADVRRISDVLRLPQHVVPRLEALATAALAANTQGRFGSRAIEISIGALACALARQEGLPLPIVEAARACNCHAIIISRAMGRLARTLGIASAAAASGQSCVGPAPEPSLLHGADGPTAQQAAHAAPGGTVAPNDALLVPVVDPATLVADIAQKLAREGACVPRQQNAWHAICTHARTLLSIGRASSLYEGRRPAHLAAAAVLIAASEAGVAAPADAAAAALGVGVKTLRLRIHELVAAALRLVAPLPAAVTAAASAAGAAGERANAPGSEGDAGDAAGSETAAAQPSGPGDESADGYGGTAAGCGGDARKRGARKRGRDGGGRAPPVSERQGYFAAAAAASGRGQGGLARARPSALCSFGFVCMHAHVLLGAAKAREAAAGAAAAAAAAAGGAARCTGEAAAAAAAEAGAASEAAGPAGPVAPPPHAPGSALAGALAAPPLPPPPSFAAACARRAESERRVRSAQLRIARAHGEAARAALGSALGDVRQDPPDPPDPRRCPVGPDLARTPVRPRPEDSPERGPSDAVDVAVERLLLSGVPAARLCEGLGTSRLSDGSALLSAAVRADEEAERAGTGRQHAHSFGALPAGGGAGEGQAAEGEELGDADDDEEVRAMVRTAAEVEVLRPFYDALLPASLAREPSLLASHSG